MRGGPVSQAIEEIRAIGPDKADIDRIARRHGVDAIRLRQRISRAVTFERAQELNRATSHETKTSGQTPGTVPPRRGSGEKRRTQLRFVVAGLIVKFYRQEFYRGELKLHTRRGCEQCVCGRDLVEHAVPIVSDARRPSLLCECGAVYEAVLS